MMATPTLFDWKAERDSAMAQVERNAGPCFIASAMRQAVAFLRTVESASGEEITDAIYAAGITAHDRRAMGPVLKNLARDGLIERVGYCIRKRGHGTGGGLIWRLKK